jgi:hypothetical protein
MSNDNFFSDLLFFNLNVHQIKYIDKMKYKPDLSHIIVNINKLNL